VLLHCAADELPSAETLATMIKAGGGEVVKAKAPFTDSTTAAANLAVLPSKRQAGEKWSDALQASGLVCVTPAYLVDWVAQPWASLDEHVVAGRRKGGELGRLEAARGQQR
jgi:hypothetical protein